MFWDDIRLVTEQIEKYGLQLPMADLGGMDYPCIADYNLTIATGEQFARYVSLAQRPFDHIDPQYLILNPDKGDPPIEDLPYQHQNKFGTITCLNVIEHIHNPFRVFAALYQLLKEGGLLVVETVFSFPYHPSPDDYWRFSPACLRYLAESAGFIVLEADWRLTIPANRGIRDIHTNEPQEIRSVYATLTKGKFKAAPSGPYQLPVRISQNADANRLIQENFDELLFK
jgi:SAM-dependent methyltransferase